MRWSINEMRQLERRSILYNLWQPGKSFSRYCKEVPPLAIQYSLSAKADKVRMFIALISFFISFPSARFGDKIQVISRVLYSRKTERLSFIWFRHCWRNLTIYPPASDEPSYCASLPVLQPIRRTAPRVATRTGELFSHLFTLARPKSGSYFCYGTLSLPATS